MNPNVLAFFATLRSVLIAIGAAMAALNLGGTHTYSIIMEVSGAVMIVGPLLWAVFEKLVTLKKTFAAAVQAGINLATSGQAVDGKGDLISKFAPDATPPKDVTVATAAAIIKEYAPPPASISKS